MICEESLHGNVLESIAINFKQLNLTVERASIDFKDPHILVFLQKLLPAIADHLSYSPLMKAALFNSLYPLIASHQAELIPLIKQWRSSLVLNQSELILPDVFEDDSNKILRAIYLHPSYCGALSLQSIEAGRGRRLYVLPEESSCHPVFAKTIHGVLHVFIRSDILSHQDAKFNLFLLNLWLEQKFNAKHCIDVSTVLHQIQPSDQKTPLSPASEDMFFQFDLIPQSDDEFVTLDLLIKENGIEEYSKMTDFTFFQNFYRQPQFANLFPKIWLLGKKQALEQEMLQENEESKVKRDQLEWFARFIQSSPIRYSFLCEQNFFHFSDLHRVCLDATDLPLDRFCEVVQTVFNYLDNCAKFENKPIACLEAKRYLNFLIHIVF